MDKIAAHGAAVYVGLDYHQASIQVCVLDAKGTVLANQRCANSVPEVMKVADRWGWPIQAAIESCCGAAPVAEELMERGGWHVDLAHPGYVQRMKQNPDKTDYSDAQMLAELERVGFVPRVWLAPPGIRELRRLVRFRQQLVQERRAIKLRVAALIRDQRVPPLGGKRWTKRWTAWLRETNDFTPEGRWIVNQHLVRMELATQQIRQVEERLQQVTAEDALVQRLREQKGVGLITASTLRAEIGRFDRFRSGKQTARFCGLSPCNRSSGQRQADAGIIRAGNPQLRATIIETAQRLIRFDDHWGQFAAKMLNRGKPKCVVVVAVANRWIRRLYHQMVTPPLAA